MQDQIEIYPLQAGSTQLEVQFNPKTVWISQAQIVKLFGRTQSVISGHIRHAIADGKISEQSNMQKIHMAFSDCPVSFYDVDTVISVDDRVKSKVGTPFRIWASH